MQTNPLTLLPPPLLLPRQRQHLAQRQPHQLAGRLHAAARVQLAARERGVGMTDALAN